MSDTPTPIPPAELITLIEALLDATIDDAQFARLNNALRDDPQARSLYRRYMNLHASLPTIIGNAPRLSIQATDDPADQIALDDDPGAMLADLAQLEDSAEADVISFTPHKDGPHEGAGSRSTHDLAVVGRYVLRHALTPRRLAYAGVAAALLVAATLFIVLQSGQNESPELATPPIEIIRPAQPVATLTNTHNAQWAGAASAAPAPGDALRSGQRLTLTAGFAEITTHRGAVVLLEAPAAFELTDNENALRLHAGKLVGICETGSSKGFRVHTPHMEITDLGTEFGVEVTPGRETHLQVFKGSVSAAAMNRQNQIGKSRVLSSEQAARATADEGMISDAFLPNRFGAQRGMWVEGQIKESFDSGLSLLTGQTESNDFILLVPERKAVLLEQPLALRLPDNGPADLPTPRTLPAGSRVDSYTVHFDSAGSRDGSGNDKITLRGEVRFDRPILGVILEYQQYHETTTLLGSHSVQYPFFELHTGIDGWGDRVTIGADGKTLRLELSATLNSPGIDQVRVLVQAEQPQE